MPLEPVDDGPEPVNNGEQVNLAESSTVPVVAQVAATPVPAPTVATESVPAAASTEGHGIPYQPEDSVQLTQAAPFQPEDSIPVNQADPVSQVTAAPPAPAVVAPALAPAPEPVPLAQAREAAGDEQEPAADDGSPPWYTELAEGVARRSHELTSMVPGPTGRIAEMASPANAQQVAEWAATVESPQQAWDDATAWAGAAVPEVLGFNNLADAGDQLDLAALQAETAYRQYTAGQTGQAGTSALHAAGSAMDAVLELTPNPELAQAVRQWEAHTAFEDPADGFEQAERTIGSVLAEGEWAKGDRHLLAGRYDDAAAQYGRALATIFAPGAVQDADDGRGWRAAGQVLPDLGLLVAGGWLAKLARPVAALAPETRLAQVVRPGIQRVVPVVEGELVEPIVAARRPAVAPIEFIDGDPLVVARGPGSPTAPDLYPAGQALPVVVDPAVRLLPGDAPVMPDLRNLGRLPVLTDDAATMPRLAPGAADPAAVMPDLRSLLILPGREGAAVPVTPGGTAPTTYMQAGGPTGPVGSPPVGNVTPLGNGNGVRPGGNGGGLPPDGTVPPASGAVPGALGGGGQAANAPATVADAAKTVIDDLVSGLPPERAHDLRIRLNGQRAAEQRVVGTQAGWAHDADRWDLFDLDRIAPGAAQQVRAAEQAAAGQVAAAADARASEAALRALDQAADAGRAPVAEALRDGFRAQADGLFAQARQAAVDGKVDTARELAEQARALQARAGDTAGLNALADQRIAQARSVVDAGPPPTAVPGADWERAALDVLKRPGRTVAQLNDWAATYRNYASEMQAGLTAEQAAAMRAGEVNWSRRLMDIAAERARVAAGRVSGGGATREDVIARLQESYRASAAQLEGRARQALMTPGGSAIEARNLATMAENAANSAENMNFLRREAERLIQEALGGAGR